MIEKYQTGEFAELKIGDKIYQLPIVKGTEDEKAIDIRKLRVETGHIALDSGYMNTGSCASSITFLDGEKGILRYRGYPVEILAETCSFVEVAYLLVHGTLPDKEQRNNFSILLGQFALIHEDMIHFFDGYPAHAHPMAILSSMVNSLSSFYPEMMENPFENMDYMVTRILSKMRTIAAFSYKKSIGHPLVYPRHDLSYCANFLNMMFDSPVQPYIIRPEAVEALNKVLILHGDHEQNCSTTTVRIVGSAKVNLYACISAGISALWGPLHGGANQAVVEMLQKIYNEGGNYKKYIEMAKDPKNPFRLFGFGHRVYKIFDPRAKVIKQACHELLEALDVSDPLLDIAQELEQITLSDDYFLSRHLYPNVDFYSGIIYRALKIPTKMFPVMFALGRLPGWIAHWKELCDDQDSRLGRPRQIYVGPTEKEFVPIHERKGESNL